MRDGGERRHSLDGETPLPVYVGLLLHTKTRKDGLVNKLSRLGLCISYDRVCDIKESIASHLCKEYEERKLVQPASMKDGLFTLPQLTTLSTMLRIHLPNSILTEQASHFFNISERPSKERPSKCHHNKHNRQIQPNKQADVARVLPKY